MPKIQPPEKIHFISGLPRSGSTLLSALLRQNPRFHADITSPVGDMVGALVVEMSGKNDFSVAVSDTRREAVLRGLFQNYYTGFTEANVVFDTHRVWCSKMPLLATLFPQAKVIACVRELPWVVDSMERLIHEQPLGTNKIFHFAPSSTVYTRAEALINVEGMVGFAYQATKEAWYGDCAPGRLLLLTYESLTRDPKSALQAVYQFIEEPWFEHDFEHIAFDAEKFDSRLGLPGLHKVKTKVAPPTREPLLPPDLFQRFVPDSFWLDPKTNIRKVPIV